MSSNAHDLVIRGGTVVTAGSRAACDIGISDGRIAQIGGPLTGQRELDASGAYVLPGGLDLHVHLSAAQPAPGSDNGFVDDFTSGSRAAIAGGVTTIGQMSFAEDGWEVTDAIARDLAAGQADSTVDFVLHPGLVTATRANLDDVVRLGAEGHKSLKIVTIAFDYDSSNLVAAVKRAGDNGMLTLIHCEDEALIQFLGEDLVRSGHGSLSHYPQSRPDFTERAAVERAVAICEATGAPILIVHLSSRSALRVAREAQQRGLPVFVETRPMYLHLTDAVHDGPDAGKFVGMPPVRSQDDVDALWQGLADGSIHTIASDHAPWTLDAKLDASLDVNTARKGVADLETTLPMLFSAGVLTGRISLERFVALTSTNAARLYGLYPRKGTIAIGSDADLVVLDPRLSRMVNGRTMQSRAGYSVYDGTEVTGWPRFTISRGDVVLADGEITAAPGRGRWLERRPAVRTL